MRKHAKVNQHEMGRPLRYGGSEPMQSLQVRLPTPMTAWIDKMAGRGLRSAPPSKRARAKSRSPSRAGFRPALTQKWPLAAKCGLDLDSVMAG